MSKRLEQLRAKLPSQLGGASDETLVCAAAWFGMMRPNGEGYLHFAMEQSRPSVVGKAALDDLVQRGVIEFEADAHGPGFTYRPLVDCGAVFNYVLAARIGAGVFATEPIT